MFIGANEFNQPLDDWNVASVLLVQIETVPPLPFLPPFLLVLSDKKQSTNNHCLFLFRVKYHQENLIDPGTQPFKKKWVFKTYG